MSSLGRFLEFSVRTADILDSLAYYKTLGFTELEVGEVWPHKYAVVSDGLLSIGLHDREFASPALTFVHHEINIIEHQQFLRVFFFKRFFDILNIN